MLANGGKTYSTDTPLALLKVLRLVMQNAIPSVAIDLKELGEGGSDV